jgi:hypothetical protein
VFGWEVEGYGPHDAFDYLVTGAGEKVD